MHDALIIAYRHDYDCPAPDIKLLQDGQAGNKAYLAESEHGKNILKVYGTYWHDKVDWIRNELDLLVFLAAKEVSVATAVSRADGDLLSTVDTPEGKRYYAAFAFAEGAMEWPLSEPRSRSLGAALARMHLAADEFQAPRPWREYDIDRLIDRPLERMLPYIVDHPNEITSLRRLSEQIKVYLHRIPTGNGEYGVIHGDIHQGNVHFTSGEGLTFFDFSLCGIGWRAYDFAGFLWPTRDETIQNPAIRLSCDSFLAGYRSVRDLSTEEEAAIPAFVKLRDLWETGDWLECGTNLEAQVVAKGIVGLVARFDAAPLKPVQ